MAGVQRSGIDRCVMRVLKGFDMLKIELTEEQKEKLKGFFEAVNRGNKKGIATAIAGQVWEDGLVVKLVSGEGGRALSNALGGNWDVTHRTAESRIRKPHNA